MLIAVLWGNYFISSKYRRKNWDVGSLNKPAQGYKANEWLSSSGLNKVSKIYSLCFLHKSKIMSASSQLQILQKISSNINSPASILQYRFKAVELEGETKVRIKKNNTHTYTHTFSMYTTWSENS